jgi:hypothetical protein
MTLSRLALISALASLALTPSLSAAPSVFWTASPVLPDESVYLQGDGLDRGVKVEYARLPDGEPGDGLRAADPASLTWSSLAPLQAAGSSFVAALPANEQMGAFLLRLSGDGKTAATEINLPDVWWTQGQEGRAKARAGGWLRVFGRSLQLGGQPARALLRSGERSLILPLAGKSDGYSLAFDLPKDLANGSYAVSVHNGFGGAAGWRSAGELSVVTPLAWPDRVFDVSTYGAKPNDNDDDAAGIQAALDAAGKAGGGVVFIPRGRYMVSVGLKVPRHVTLRGESRELVALQWYDYGISELKPNTPSFLRKGEPPLALIHGDAFFRVQDLTMYSWSHYHGILAQHWKGEGNVHVERVRTRLNETTVNVGRFYAAKNGEADAEFREFQARRERRFRLWTASFQAGGPNISVEDCDFEDNGFGIIIDNGEGVVIRNSRFYQAFSKGTHAMILENNKLSEFWPGTHDSMEDPLRRRGIGARVPNASTQYMYMARNTSKNADGDREPSSLDSHGPFGTYLGPVASVVGSVVTLNELSASGQKPGKNAPVGYGVYILDGKGAGQYRRVAGGGGTRIEMDRPFDVAPDATSVFSIAKYHGELLYIDNDFTDTGDIQIWGGAVHTVFKGTKLTRTGGFNQAGGFIFGGVIPIWYLEQFDTHVVEGNNAGSPPFFQLRSTKLSMNTYRHAEFYTGPCVRGGVLRRVLAEDNTMIDISGAVQGALVEHSLLKNTEVGINVASHASYYKDPNLPKERRAPADIVLRENHFENVSQPFTGDAVTPFKPKP